MALHATGHPAPLARPGQRSALRRALGLNAVLLLGEVVGGLAFGSLALIADAGHMLADVLGLAVALAGVILSARPMTRGHSYGFARAEVLAAQVSALLLLAGGVWVTVEAWSRLTSPESGRVDATGLMAVASAGVVINLISAVMVHRAEGESLNMRASVVHLATDAVGSVAALCAGALIWAFGWGWADSAASMLIAVIVVGAGVRLLAQSTHILMEGTPAGLDADEVRAAIGGVAGVAGVHHLHLWNLASDLSACSAHVVVAGTPSLAQAQRVGGLVRAVLDERFGIRNATLELEDEGVLEVGVGASPSQTTDSERK